MEKKSRLSSIHAHPGLIENGSPPPQGAPRGVLHFYSLLSISRKPMRGYDLMKEIEGKTGGAWRPGPGAVYPTLRRLKDQGLIAVEKNADSRATQVLYRITPAGLRNVNNAKKMMRSSSEKWNLMRSLFIDLMEPEDLVRFAITSFEMQIETLHAIVGSEKSRLSDQDRLFVLRQYRLNMERELARTVSLIDAMEAQTRPKGHGRKEGPA